MYRVEKETKRLVTYTQDAELFWRSKYSWWHRGLRKIWCNGEDWIGHGIMVEVGE
jgi:hypothetical protein